MTSYIMEISTQNIKHIIQFQADELQRLDFNQD